MATRQAARTVAKRAPRKANKRAVAKRAPARKRPPPPDRRHAVRASLRNVDLTKATTALTLVLRNEGEKMGELVVGRGSFFWKARNGKKRKRITWSDFAAMMDRHPG